MTVVADDENIGGVPSLAPGNGHPKINVRKIDSNFSPVNMVSYNSVSTV